MEFLRPNDQRAKTAIALIWIVMTITIISILSAYFQYRLLDSAANGVDISAAEANANDQREQAIAILYLLAYVVSAVTFLNWFRRAYFNLHLKVTALTNSEGMAAGSWFIPFVNLYRPFQIMKELYTETRILLHGKGLINDKQLSTKLLGPWWTLWIICGILGQVVFRLTMDADSIKEFTKVTFLSIVGDFLQIALSFLAVKVIKDYSGIEHLLYEVNDDQEVISEDVVTE